MKTKAYVKFLNSKPVYQCDMELTDVLSSSPTKFDPRRHPTLSKLSMTPKERMKRVNHLKSTVYEALVKRLYEQMMLYFMRIVNCMIVNGVSVNQLLGSDQVSMSEREVLAAGSWEKVCERIAGNVLRTLEQKRDTEKLLTTINSRLGLGIPKSVFDKAKPYIETRHLLVHNDGMADARFEKLYAHEIKVVHGNIIVDYNFVQRAVDAVERLLVEYDKRLVSKSLIPKTYQQC